MLSIAALLLAALGLATALAVAWPDESSQFFRPSALSAPRAVAAAGAFLRHPAHAFPDMLWGAWPWLGALAIWVVALALLGTPFLLLAFAAGVAGLSLFFDLIYPGGMRHQGMVVVLLAGVVWLLPSARAVPLPAPIEMVVAPQRRWGVPAVLAAVLLAQVPPAWRAVAFDLTHDMTSAKAFGKLLRERFPDSIVIGEPDDALESLPFYAPNRIYIPRERRFGDWTHFTLANQPAMSLGELVRTGRWLRRATGKPVLLAFGYRFRGNRRLAFSHLGRRLFTWSDEDMALFQRETAPVAAFFGAASENYRIYAFR